MRRIFHGRAGTALAFMLGLLIATAGTATAAKLITGKQIKDGSISSKDLSKAVRAQLARTGAAGATGAPGAKGDGGSAGSPGAKGDSGVRGVSAWETIPSGVTVTGSEAIAQPSGAISAFYTTTVHLGARAPQALLNASVNFAADAFSATVDDDPACTGTAVTPTAPPGKVCLYASTLTNAASVSGVAHVLGGEHSFRVAWNAVTGAADPMFLTFTWAYTAP